MFEIFTGIFYGVLQGVTEFLPISSSGHMVAAATFFDLKQPSVYASVMTHVATALAVLIFFAQRLIKLPALYLLKIMVGALPTAIIGVLIQPFMSSFFASPHLVMWALVVTSAINLGIWKRLTANHQHDQHVYQISFKQAALIGFAQPIALVPGISRSGTALLASLMAGLSPQAAFLFSFLTAVPLILGAGLFEIVIDSPPVIAPSLLWSFGVSFLIGLLSLQFLSFSLRRKNYFVAFAIYCVLVSIGLMLSLAFA